MLEMKSDLFTSIISVIRYHPCIFDMVFIKETVNRCNILVLIGNAGLVSSMSFKQVINKSTKTKKRKKTLLSDLIYDWSMKIDTKI